MNSNQMRLQKLLVMPLIAVLLALAACSSGTTTHVAPQSPTPAQQVPAGTSSNTTATAPTPAQTTTPELSSLPQLKVHFFDVGQGDSILIDLGEVEVLIDGGDKSPGVVNYLNLYVDGAIEVMVATHTHADHIGGLIEVLAKYQVSDIWLNGDTATSTTFRNFMNLVNAEGANIHQAERGNTIQAGNLKLLVLNPRKPLFSDANNNSIVLSLSYGDVEFLFTGDAEAEAEGAMLVQSLVPIPDVEILKVGHHGSRTASSSQFLNIVKPEVAIYMCGVGNTYGHPHQETIIALNNIGAKIYGTDINGTITVITDGKTYDVQLQKQAPPVNPSTVSPSPALPPGPTPGPTSAASAGVQITGIFYDGAVPRTESDEFVEITNLGIEPVDLKGWVLKDITDGSPSFIFPAYVLEPGKSIRVYTNEVHREYGGFNFGSGTSIWNNTRPDTAALYDAQGQEISRKSY